MATKEWKNVKGTLIAPKPVLPGVWQRKDGGHVVRGRVKCPRTGKLREVWRVLPDADQATAYKWLQEELVRLRAGVTEATSPKVHFANYAVSLLERKIANREIRSVAGKRKWATVLAHLIRDELGEHYIDMIRPRDVEAWKTRMAKHLATGEYAVTTLNTWLSVLKVILGHAKRDFELPTNPAADVTAFDTTEHHTYTVEEPNSLTVEEVRSFLAKMKELYPQHYAMTFTGFATGLRPSSLRPLRRRGPTPDVLWDECALLIRQSQTDGDEVMQSTKTGKRQRIAVPQSLIDVLKWHVDTQLNGPMRDSDLLFPSEIGKFRTRSVLDKPFAKVTRAVHLTKKLTPRGMRRTFQDLARAARVDDIVTRSISGHATEEMQDHYSTVDPREQIAGLERVVGIMRGPTD